MNEIVEGQKNNGGGTAAGPVQMPVANMGRNMVRCQRAPHGLGLVVLMFLCPALTAQQPEAKKEEPKAKAGGATKLSLVELSISVPEGWVSQQIEAAGPMAPKAIYTIPKSGSEAEDGEVRVTYFAGMKGKDEMNLDRWVKQATKPDGSSYTREEVKIEKSEANGVQLTIVDLSGRIKATMRDQPKPNQRMIAAIVDHEKGPHFVVATGGADLMKRVEKDIMAFLKSAKAEK